MSARYRWEFWAGEVEKCGTDAACVDRKSVDVSRAFFYSSEFIGLHPELAEQLRGTNSYNRKFVRQSYYTYLRRTCDPEVCDAAGFNFWVTKLNSHLPSNDADYNEMIRAFLVSTEYRARAWGCNNSRQRSYGCDAGQVRTTRGSVWAWRMPDDD